jgi:ubiquitin-protein ligase
MTAYFFEKKLYVQTTFLRKMQHMERKVNVVVGTVTRLHREMMAVKQSAECSRFRIQFKEDDTSRIILQFPSASFCDPTNTSAYAIFQGLEVHGQRYGREPEVKLEIVIPSEYPSSPPFVYVVYPRFAFHTGHVTVGGSICTEMLTSEGWDMNMTLESLTLALWTNLIEGKAQVMNDPDMHHPVPHAEYTEAEARSAYTRVVEHHRKNGW